MNNIVCQICNKEMSIKGIGPHITKTHKMSMQEYYDTFLKKPEDGICVVCGKPTNFYSITTGYARTCSYRCGTLDPKAKEKYKQTCIKKYGVESSNQSEEVKKHMRQACKDKYGVEFHWQSQQNKDKIKESYKKHYGTEHIQTLPEIQQKIRKTKKEHYGNETYNNTKQREQTNLNK